ncbi:MAG: ATP phosphoribosyltransferase regulatory subunit [Dehalococcoidia bacterium]
MKIPRCKGASDMMPDNMLRFRHIEEVFRASCLAWGYREIRTPTLEYLHLFTSAGTLSPEMLSRVYSFLDWDGWSGERVVLRPDGTIPSARCYVENMLDKPVARLCYVENMFSFEGSGQQSRERWQCGAELIGGTEPEGDTELIMLALEVLNKLSLQPVKVKLSHVGLFKTLLDQLGYDEEEQRLRLKEILTGDASILDELSKQPQTVRRFLKLLLGLKGKSRGSLENLESILPGKLSAIKPYIRDLAQVAELLDRIGQEYELDFASGEGFEYYTGMVYEFYSGERVVGNGGRYDELIPLVGGDAAPASGFALFMDSIHPVRAEESFSEQIKILLSSKVSHVEGMKHCFEIAGILRREGYIVEIDLGENNDAEYHWIVSFYKKSRRVVFNLVDITTGEEQKDLSRKQMLQVLKSGGK